jgi:hypothetical protein
MTDKAVYPMLSFLMLVNVVLAADITVSPGGSLQDAADAAGPGDRVIVAAGTYNQRFSIGNSGTEQSPLVFEAAAGETPVVDGGNNGYNIVSISGDYVVFRGFSVQNSPGNCINITGDGVTIENCVTSYAQNRGINFAHCADGRVIGCEVFECVRQNWPRGQNYTNGGWGMGLSIQGGSNWLVQDCRVHNNHGEGIGVWGNSSSGGTKGARIINNIVYDNWSVNIWNDHGTDVWCEGNFVYCTPDRPAQDQGRSTPSAFLSAEEASFGQPGDLRNGVYVNNIVTGCGSGFAYWHDGGPGLVDFVIANNTFVDNNVGLSIDQGEHDGTVFSNNIWVQSNDRMAWLSGSGFTFNDNLWYSTGGGSLPSEDSESLFEDPFLAGGDPLDPLSYALQSGSPCIGVGVSISQVTADFWGNERPAVSPSIGAHESTEATALYPLKPAGLEKNASPFKAVTSSLIIFNRTGQCYRTDGKRLWIKHGEF